MSNFNTDQVVVASDFPAKNAYGQNAYLGPASIEPGKPTPTASIKATPPDPVRDHVAKFGAQSVGTMEERQLAPAHGIAT